MATSSIFHLVVITDPEKANAFVDALCELADDPSKRIKPIHAIVTDPKRINEIMEANRRIWGAQKKEPTDEETHERTVPPKES